MNNRRKLGQLHTGRALAVNCNSNIKNDTAQSTFWNGLPSDVTSALSLAVFGRRLKTELFRRCYNAA